jgi:hypothetical protein
MGFRLAWNLSTIISFDYPLERRQHVLYGTRPPVLSLDHLNRYGAIQSDKVADALTTWLSELGITDVPSKCTGIQSLIAVTLRVKNALCSPVEATEPRPEYLLRIGFPLLGCRVRT